MPIKVKSVQLKRKLRPLQKRGKSTVTIKGHQGDAQKGHVERLNAFTKRALELSQLGHIYVDIAEMIAAEFNLERTPCVATISNWLTKGDIAYNQDIDALRWQQRLAQFNKLDKMLNKWMPLATAQRLEITRWRSVEGELQPELDENALQEQLDATKAIVAIMARQAKLLGLDLEKAVTAEGDGPTSLQSLQVWLIGQIQNQPAIGAPIDIKGEVLELAAGLPESDAV